MSVAGRLARGGGALQGRLDTDPLTAFWRNALVGEQSFTGREVTVESALRVDTIAACVQLLVGTIGPLPLRVYEGDVDGESNPVPSHPTSQLLRMRPNPELPPVALWGLAMTHLLTQGDSFLGKTFVGNRVTELWPITPRRVQVQRVNGRKEFVLDGDFDRPLNAGTIIHVQGLSLDGIRGLSPIGLAREAVGAGLAIDEYTNRTFGNSAVPLGVLETDQDLSDSAYKRLKRSWKKQHGGLGRAGEIAILEAGLKYHALSMPLKDLEFVALSNLTSLKIARVYRCPASMLDIEVGNKGLHYTSASSDDMHYLKHTVRVWLDRIAQSLMLDADLFPARAAIFCKHDVSRLLEAEPETRARIRQTETGGAAWRLPSEVRTEDGYPAAPELDDAATRPPPAPAAPAPPAPAPAAE